MNRFEYLFGEDQGRYIIEIKNENLKKVYEILNENSVHFDEIGKVTGDHLIYNSELKISIEDLNKTYTNWLKSYMLN